MFVFCFLFNFRGSVSYLQITVDFTFSKLNSGGGMGTAESVTLDPPENKYVNKKLGLQKL